MFHEPTRRDSRRLAETTAGARLHELDYNRTPDGLVASIVETDDQAQVSTVTFTYDNRNRLTAEARTGTHPYSMTYDYDAAGNRVRKIDNLNAAITSYTYDVSDPDLYNSQGNRLMHEQREQGGNVVEQRWYRYDDRGRADLVIRKLGAADPWYYGTRLYYDTAGHVHIAVAERWQLDGQGQPQQCENLSAMEYRYTTGRARYLVRALDPATLLPVGGTAYEGAWHDYDGDDIYGDYTIGLTNPPPPPEGPGSPLTATDTFAHEPGLAQFEHATAALHHLHGNLIGTTERMTDANASIARRSVFTAFGELVSSEPGSPNPGSTRYGYAGAWGYEAPGTELCATGGELVPCDPLAALGWLHVGERYYDPASGRFVQRDPIGINGGLNVYVYVANSPAFRIDPSGLELFQDIYDLIDGFVNGGGLGGNLGTTGAGIVGAGAANYKWGLGIGRAVNRGGVACAGLYIGWNAGQAITDNTQLDEWLGEVFFDLWSWWTRPPSPGYVPPKFPPHYHVPGGRTHV